MRTRPHVRQASTRAVVTARSAGNTGCALSRCARDRSRCNGLLIGQCSRTVRVARDVGDADLLTRSEEQPAIVPKPANDLVSSLVVTHWIVRNLRNSAAVAD
jgi:hypothetical protein